MLHREPGIAPSKEHPRVKTTPRTVAVFAVASVLACAACGPQSPGAAAGPVPAVDAAGATSNADAATPSNAGPSSPGSGTSDDAGVSDEGSPVAEAAAPNGGSSPADGGAATDGSASGDSPSSGGEGSGDGGFVLGGGNPSSMGLDRHDALYCGEWQKTNTVGDTIYVIRGGKVAWTHSLATSGQDEFGDCWMASNGHVFFNRKQFGAQEIVPDTQTGKEGTIVWEYQEDKGTEVHSVQPIGLDKVLVMQNGLPLAKLMLIDKTKAMSCTSNMPCVLQTWPLVGGGTQVHGMFRHVRMLANGNLLIPYTTGGKVVEYTQSMQVVWDYPVAGSPWAAIRLKNGNTLISGNAGGWVQEVTPAKQIVWQVTKTGLPFPLYTTQNMMRLANGNTLINNWCPGGLTNTAQWPTCIQVTEVTPAMQVVWKVQSWTDPNLGPGSSTQLLDQPGIPENPGDLQY
jgi:hypothetical protein